MNGDAKHEGKTCARKREKGGKGRRDAAIDPQKDVEDVVDDPHQSADVGHVSWVRGSERGSVSKRVDV